MESHSSPMFRQTILIAAPADRVWNALVTPAEVTKYYLCPLAAIELEPGGRIAYGPAAKPLISGTVEEVIPQQTLVHTFRFAAEVGPSVADDPESRVTYALAPMGVLCQLTLTHDRFGSENQTYTNVIHGWPTILSGLKALLETGKPLAWPAADSG